MAAVRLWGEESLRGQREIIGEDEEWKMESRLTGWEERGGWEGEAGGGERTGQRLRRSKRDLGRLDRVLEAKMESNTLTVWLAGVKGLGGPSEEYLEVVLEARRVEKGLKEVRAEKPRLGRSGACRVGHQAWEHGGGQKQRQAPGRDQSRSRRHLGGDDYLGKQIKKLRLEL
jgi:hypothetical protein